VPSILPLGKILTVKMNYSGEPTIIGELSGTFTNERRLPHDDNIEMSGSLVSGIIKYKVDGAKQVHIIRDIIFPQLRNYTRSTESMYRAYLRSEYKDDLLPVITIGEKKFKPAL
jgi:hypothetical protein